MTPAAHRALGALSIALVANIAGATSTPREILLAWQALASDPAERTLVWADSPTLPAAAVNALEKLRSAALALGHRDLVLLTDEYTGRSVAATNAFGVKPDPATPSGVTVWPDWQLADKTVSFPDVS